MSSGRVAEFVPLEEESDETFSDHFYLAQRMESGILLHEALALMSDEERRIFVLRLNGFSYREIAVVVKTSHVTVSHRIREITKKVQDAIFRSPP